MNENLRISYRDYRLPLLAGIPYSLDVGGNYWQFVKASAASEIDITFDESQTISRLPGTGGPALFSRVMLLSGVDQIVVMSFGFTGGLAPYDRGNSVFAGTINVAASVPSINAPLDDAVIAAASSQLLVGIDLFRRALIIKNASGSVGPVRLGDSSVSATRGLLLEEGETANIDGTSALYAYNPNGSAVTLTLLSQSLP